MLFVPESIIKKRQRAMKDLKDHKRNPRQVFEQMLQLDPDDHVSLCMLGGLHVEEGDASAAETYFWRAIHADPSYWQSHMQLFQVLSGDPGRQEVAFGLMALALRKLSMDADELADVDVEPLLKPIRDSPKMRDLSRPEALQVLAMTLEQQRDSESAATSALLRPHRLIQDLQEAEDLPPELVERLLAEGASLVPLLAGVLRSWTRALVPEERELMARNALALLGEIGDPSVVPYLIEFAVIDQPVLSATAEWALDRMARLNPELVAKALGVRRVQLHTDPGPTVYDICAGRVIWDDEDEEDGDLDEHVGEEPEPFVAPAPMRRQSTPGRNDPCWCGSGRKYKKCHQDSDQTAARGEPAAPKSVFDSLRTRILDFMTEAAPPAETRHAIESFIDADDDIEQQKGPFVDWMVHDWILPRHGRTVMQEFLRRRGASLTERERAIVDSWSRSYVGLYEVQNTRPGTGLELKDMLTGAALFVHDTRISSSMVRWDGLLARIVEEERGLEFSGVGLSVPRRQLGTLHEWIEKDQKKTGEPWPEYFKRNAPRVHRQLCEICREWRDSIRLSNTDGEELLFSTALYSVTNPGAVIAALRKVKEIDETEKGKHFVWLNGPASKPGNTVLANIDIKDGSLKLECNSRERLERAKHFLAKLAGSAIKHSRDHFTTQEELKRRASEGPARPSKPSGIPPEVEHKLVTQMLERHYAEWPDMRLPALSGKTPREAVRTAAGRRKVIDLLRDIENGEAHRRKEGETTYDVDLLRAELNLLERPGSAGS